MKTFLTFIIAAFTLLPLSGSDLDAFTKSADAFLKKYVTNGSVAYAKIHANKSEVNALYREIGSLSLSGANDNMKKAFYINAYNIVVIYSIIQRYPVKSPMGIEGFFDRATHSIAGENLTLNALEKEKLIAVYKDPRFHFVLVCAAKSCPTLMSGAYESSQIDAQLEQRTRLTINDKNWLKISSSEKKAEVSKIFEWYNGDFTNGGTSLLEWINQYRTAKIPSAYKVTYYEYDWALND